MRSLTYVLIGGVCIWIGTVIENARHPLPPVYIVKCDKPRCDLIDRFTKRKASSL